MRTLPERRGCPLDSVLLVTWERHVGAYLRAMPGSVRDSEATSPGTGHGIPSSSRSLCPGNSGILLLITVFG